MHFASYCGHTDIIRILVNNSADLHMLNYDHMSPLMFAAKKGEQVDHKTCQFSLRLLVPLFIIIIIIIIL